MVRKGSAKESNAGSNPVYNEFAYTNILSLGVVLRVVSDKNSLDLSIV